jgi:hypothetical protein
VTLGGGAVAAVTENAFASVPPALLVVLVTVTLRGPRVATEEIVMFALSCVEEFGVQEFTVTPTPKLQTELLSKLLPVISTGSV